MRLQARSVAPLPRFVEWPRSSARSGPPVRFSRGPLHSGLTNCFLVSLKTGWVPFCSLPTTDRLSNDSPRRSFRGSAQQLITNVVGGARNSVALVLDTGIRRARRGPDQKKLQ